MASIINDVGPVSLTPVGARTATADGQVFYGLDITANGAHGINANGFSITVEHCRIRHTGGAGIFAEGAGKTVRIRNCDIAHTGQPAQGAGISAAQENIHIANAAYLEVRRNKLAKGAAGIWATLVLSGDVMENQGSDFRGPLPRGQFYQFDKCKNIRLRKNYGYNDPNTAYNEDICSSYQCSDMFADGDFVDWCNAPNGQGFINEEAKGPHTSVNLYAKGMWNGAFAAIDGNMCSFVNCHSKANVTVNPSSYRSGSSLSGNPIFCSFPDESPPLPDATFGQKYIGATYESPGNPSNIVFDNIAARMDVYSATLATKAEPVITPLTWRWAV